MLDPMGEQPKVPIVDTKPEELGGTPGERTPTESSTENRQSAQPVSGLKRAEESAAGSPVREEARPSTDAMGGRAGAAAATGGTRGKDADEAPAARGTQTGPQP